MLVGLLAPRWSAAANRGSVGAPSRETCGRVFATRGVVPPQPSSRERSSPSSETAASPEPVTTIGRLLARPDQDRPAPKRTEHASTISGDGLKKESPRRASTTRVILQWFETTLPWLPNRFPASMVPPLTCLVKRLKSGAPERGGARSVCAVCCHEADREATVQNVSVTPERFYVNSPPSAMTQWRSKFLAPQNVC